MSFCSSVRREGSPGSKKKLNNEERSILNISLNSVWDLHIKFAVLYMKKIIMRSVILLAVLFSGLSVFAQINTRITGKIMDATTQKPVEYATITLADKQSGKVVN